MTKKTKIIFGVCSAIVVIAAIVGAVLIFGGQKKEEPQPTTTVAETTTAEVVEETTTEESHEGQAISHLTGDYVDEKIAKRRPVAVMYNNIIDAIPHSGIDNADVLYESPVEGGITRIMAIFENYDKLKKMGSVRSCRIYYCYFALEWDAIYCHFGQSKYALDFLKSDHIDNVGAFNAESAYYRTSDRVAPHNAFTSGAGVNKAIQNLGYRKKYEKNYQSKFQFAAPDETIALSGKTKAGKVEIGYPINHPYFVYNKKDGQYYRYQYGKKHIDDQNKKQLHCSNIIIQFVDATLYPDGKSLDMTLTGSGSGWYITGGKAEKVTWKKSKKEGRTTYYDKDGNEIILNTGKTWICMVQNEYAGNVTMSK